MSEAALKPAVALKTGQTAEDSMSRKTCMSAPRMGGWLVLYGFCDHSQQPSLWQEAGGRMLSGVRGHAPAMAAAKSHRILFRRDSKNAHVRFFECVFRALDKKQSPASVVHVLFGKFFFSRRSPPVPLHKARRFLTRAAAPLKGISRPGFQRRKDSRACSTNMARPSWVFQPAAPASFRKRVFRGL